MTRNVKISLSLIVALACGALVAVAAIDSAEEPASAAETTAADAQVLRPDTHRLSATRGDRVTVVEFLDFECESCRALYPVMEQLREEYAGRVTFAIRYFPIASHRNAQIAAQAVEAAARQGALEAMYRTMFETQEQWGEAQESKQQLFVGFARRLGLDVDRFRRDLEDPSTVARVASDQRDGVALGVTGTPTVFLDGEPLALESAEQLRADIDAALAE